MARTCGANPTDRHHRHFAKFDQQARGHHAGSAQTAPAVNDDALAERKPLTHLRTDVCPGTFPGAAGYRPIDNRQDVMGDAGRQDMIHVGDPEHFELMGLNQAEQRGGSPVGDDGKVALKITIPLAGKIGDVLPARTPGHADLSTEGIDPDAIDAQGIGLAGLFHGELPICSSFEHESVPDHRLRKCAWGQNALSCLSFVSCRILHGPYPP